MRRSNNLKSASYNVFLTVDQAEAVLTAIAEFVTEVNGNNSGGVDV
jgi:hypothetical protein